MEMWEKNLAHARADRDALVACGNPAPDHPDPNGGLIPVRAMKFNSRLYWPVMQAKGHDNPDFDACKCKRLGDVGPSM